MALILSLDHARLRGRLEHYGGPFPPKRWNLEDEDHLGEATASYLIDEGECPLIDANCQHARGTRKVTL